MADSWLQPPPDTHSPCAGGLVLSPPRSERWTPVSFPAPLEAARLSFITQQVSTVTQRTQENEHYPAEPQLEKERGNCGKEAEAKEEAVTGQMLNEVLGPFFHHLPLIRWGREGLALLGVPSDLWGTGRMGKTTVHASAPAATGGPARGHTASPGFGKA